MNELYKNEDEILGLVRKQGLLKAPADFTHRVMQSIEHAREQEVYKPLLTKRAWIILFSGFIVAIGVCWYIFSGNSTNGILPDLSGTVDRLKGLVDRFDFSFKFDTNTVLIVTLAIISMGILLSIDLWFSNNRRSDTV